MAATTALVLAGAPTPQAAEPKPPPTAKPQGPKGRPRRHRPRQRGPTPQEPPEPPEPPSFARDVMPTLGRYCEHCHGGRRSPPPANLHLDGYDGLMRGGDSGAVILPGNPQGSLLVAKIEHRHKPSMPPRRTLPADLVAKIRAWVAAGAMP